jgi:uncharacterized protein involved in outer membrane biogenesis
MKALIKFIVILLLIIMALLVIGKNLVAKTVVVKSVKAMTGLQMDIKDMDVGIAKTLIGIKEMTVYNSPGFSDRVMVDMPEIYIDYELGSFLKGKAHLEKMRIHLNKLNVIRNKDKTLNLDTLNIVKDSKQTEQSREPEKKAEIRIDTLELKIGTVIYKDYSFDSKPRTIGYNVNINETFRNVTDLDQVGKIILTRALMKTDIANLANFALGSLKADISETLQQVVKPGAVIKELEETSGKTIKKAVEGVTKDLKLPFGK